MAHVTLIDGRELDVQDGDPVLDYYRGQGATVEDVAVELRPPYVIVNDEIVQDGEPLGSVEDLTPFDPSQHTVPEVNDYLDSEDVDDDERARVLGLEAAGDARKGILGD